MSSSNRSGGKLSRKQSFSPQVKSGGKKMRRTASDSKLQRPKLKRLSTKASKLAEKRELLLRKQGGSPKLSGGRNGSGGSRGGKYKVHSRTGPPNKRKSLTPKSGQPAIKKKSSGLGKFCKMLCSSNSDLNIDLKLPLAIEAVRRLHLSADDLRILRKNFNYRCLLCENYLRSRILKKSYSVSKCQVKK